MHRIHGQLGASEHSLDSGPYLVEETLSFGFLGEFGGRMRQGEDGAEDHDGAGFGTHLVDQRAVVLCFAKATDDEGMGLPFEFVEALGLGRATRLQQVIGQQQPGKIGIAENRAGSTVKEKLESSDGIIGLGREIFE